MKKIGIVTWHYNPNYGGILQAYALQEILIKLGYVPEFINYRHDLNSIPKRLTRRMKDAYMMIKRPRIHLGRKAKFKFIAQELNVGKLFYSYDKLKSTADSTYDACICGSDQIWSNNFGVNPYYYLDFINEFKRISYAPSIGYNEVPKELQENFIFYVKKINCLSIREEKGAEIIKSLTGRDAEVVLDPSLLLTKNEWIEKASKYKENKFKDHDSYILLYVLGDNIKYVNYAKRLSETLGLKLIALESKKAKIDGVEQYYGDPFDFIELMNNAKYILTDSFHGVAFSINLEKQFLAFKRFEDDESNSQNSRIYNILSKVNLLDRLTSSEVDVDYMTNNYIDFDNVRILLNNEREKSMNYLEKSIKKIIVD